MTSNTWCSCSWYFDVIKKSSSFPLSSSLLIFQKFRNKVELVIALMQRLREFRDNVTKIAVFLRLSRRVVHGVWKSHKMSHSTLRAKQATFTIWVDKSLSKMPNLVNFGDFLKSWILRSKSVTRQVTLNRTNVGGKCQNSNARF